jgi:hypothetical protein
VVKFNINIDENERKKLNDSGTNFDKVYNQSYLNGKKVNYQIELDFKRAQNNVNYFKTSKLSLFDKFIINQVRFSYFRRNIAQSN